MAKKIFLTTKEKRNFEKFFGKGLSIAGNILITLKECGEGMLEDFMDFTTFNRRGYKKYWTGYRFTKYKPRKEAIRINLDRLVKQGLLVKSKKEKTYFLTPEGKDIMIEFENRAKIFERPWDKKLRLVFFDIPEEKKVWRQWLRRELVATRFRMLQKSIYIGKYPLPISFYQEIVRQKIGDYIFVITAGEIDKEEEILKVFEENHE